jgi:hypothetical protein
MASSYTGLGTELMTTGENAGTWGTTTNTNLQILEQISGGYTAQSLAGGVQTTTLSVSDGSTGAVLAHRVIEFTGTITGNQTVTIPLDVQQMYVVKNNTSGAYTVNFKYVSGSGSSVTWGTSDKGTKLIYAAADDSTNPNLVDSNIGGVGAVDLNGATLTLDADADTDITADTDDQIDIRVGGTDRVRITTSAIAPSSSDGVALGTSSLEFSDLFLADSAVIKFGDDQDTTLTHTDGTGLTLNSTNKLCFQDTGTYIHSNADGDLDVVSDGTAVDSINLESAGGITLDAGTAGSGIVYEDDGTEMARLYNSSSDVILETKVSDKDFSIKGNDGGSAITALTLDMSAAGAATFNDKVIATELDISGNMDIDGTSNLDAVDIDGAVQIDATVTVGVDDTGYDFKLFGATSGSFLLWDESDDALELTDSSPIKIGDGGDMQIYHDGSNSYITNSQGALKLATETSGIAITLGHSTSEVTVADNLTVTGDLTVNGTTTTVNSTTVTIDDPIFTLGGDTAPGSDDNKDRGIEFRYHDGSSARIGFFGYDDSATGFTFLTAATNSSEVFSGTAAKIIAGELDISGDIDVDGTTNLDNTDIDGTLAVDGTTISLDATTSLNIDNSNTSNGITIGTATSGVPISIGHTTSEVTINDNLTVTGTLTLGSNAELTEAELEMLDGITAGTVAASKAVVVDSNKDAASFRNVTLTGELDAATLDISGNADIDGTTNLDAVDIDGAVQIDAAVTVGEDDTGYDVKFFGATSGAYMLWDESTDDLILAGAAKLYLYDAGGGEYLSSSGSALTIASGSAAWELPAADGSANQVLKTDGSGNLDWTSVSSAADDISAGDAAVTITTTSGNITIDAQANDSDIIFKGTDGNADTTFLTIDGSDGGTATFNHDIKVADDGQIGSASAADAMIISSGGIVTFKDDILIKDGGTIGVASVADAMTISSGGIVTFKDDIVIKDGGTIGVDSDADSITIASNGAVTFSQAPVFPDGSIAVADLDIDGATDIGEDLVDADLFIVDNGAGGTNRKVAASRVKTYIGGGTSWQAVKTSNYTASAGEGVFVNTTSAAITITLPAGTIGDEVSIVDYAGTFDSNACTVAANGSEKIFGSTDDLTVSTERAAFTLVFTDSTQGWLFKND